jgi:hypothetical protein
MDGSATLSKKSAGQQLTIAESNVLVAKMIDYLCEGFMSTNALSKKLRVSRGTVDRYRPLADDIIARQKIDRNVIRNLQVRRTYELIELLMTDLKASKDAKDRALYFNQIYKFSSHLALITGLNVETHVIADPSKLVIIRANNGDKPKKANIIEQDTEQSASVSE